MIQDFKQDLYEIFTLIDSNKPFAFMRFADGEIGIMQGRQIVGSDNWTSPNYVTKLGEDLLDSVTRTDHNVYYGFSCECCDVHGHEYLMNLVKTDLSKITYSNIFVNGNYKEFKINFEKINRPIHLISNERTNLDNFPLTVNTFLPISDNCVTFWEQYHTEFKQLLKQSYSDIRNELFVISAGPLSEVIIDYLWSINPNNQYIDFGSAIAEYVHGHPIREFAYEQSQYHYKSCIFKLSDKK